MSRLERWENNKVVLSTNKAYSLMEKYKDKNSKINIAICVCGEPRMREYGSESIKKFKKEANAHDINVDIFYHLWDHVTRRQRNHESQDPFIEFVTPEDMEQMFEPTVGFVESKNTMDPEIDFMWDHICNLNERHPRYPTKEILKNQIYYSNSPGYSQLHSLCKSQLIRIEYEEKNNIQYDLVIKTRTDVDFKLLSEFDHFKKIIRKGAFLGGDKIYFPKLEVWNVKHELLIIPEFCLVLGDSYNLRKDIWENYCEKLVLDIFYRIGDAAHLRVRNDHTVFMNLILNNVKVKAEGFLRDLFKYRLHQMPTYYDEVKTTYSHY
jgi:hypothetical protein